MIAEIEKRQSTVVIYQILIICALPFVWYVMGSYHSFIQSIVAGLKVTVLFFGNINNMFHPFL